MDREDPDLIALIGIGNTMMRLHVQHATYCQAYQQPEKLLLLRCHCGGSWMYSQWRGVVIRVLGKDDSDS